MRERKGFQAAVGVIATWKKLKCDRECATGSRSNVKAKKGQNDSYLTNAEVVGASLGIAGLAMGLFLRRRRERVAGESNQEAVETNEKATEMTTNFALVVDSPAIV